MLENSGSYTTPAYPPGGIFAHGVLPYCLLIAASAFAWSVAEQTVLLASLLLVRSLMVLIAYFVTMMTLQDGSAIS